MSDLDLEGIFADQERAAAAAAASATPRYSGKVTRVFFCNLQTPAMAGVLMTEDGEEIRFAGKCAAQVGDKLEITGEWTKHPQFGKQLKVETGLVRMDESPDALIHLLATDSRFKGLGPVRARKVVEQALQLSQDGELASALKDYADEISRRANVPLDVVQNAARVWNERKDYFDALATLCEQGWSNAQAQTIVHVLGENAPTVVKSDPYTLIGRIPRFGFKTVDAVARKLGVTSTDPGRLAAGVAFCLDQMGSDGNTWTTRAGLLDAAVQELRPDTLNGEALIEAALDELIRLELVHSDISPTGAEVVADARLAGAEFQVFEWMTEGLQTENERALSFDGPRAQKMIPTLNAGQLAALEGFANFRVGVICGGAGVGKTYLVRAICEVAEENNLRVALCAPTGKAARRLEDSTGREASTIHRLLEPMFNEQTGAFSFRRGANHPVEADLIIVDEVSMVDVRLMLSLIRALDEDGCHGPTRLLLVGDHHQIPSVSPGAILRDILSARDSFPGAVHVLREIVRQAGELARNTCAVLDGLVVSSTTPAWQIQRTERGHEEGAAAMVAVLVETIATTPEPLAPFGRQLDPAWDIQVLAPMKKGQLGVNILNVHLQRLRQRMLGNPPPEPVKPDDRPKPLIGDRVIWTRNDYVLDLFNGTQAIVVGLPKGGAMEIFTEDGREVTVPPDKRVNVEVAYAMTIHKSQGSEWPCVILVAGTPHWYMHDRSLFYTGCSRAAESLTIFGDWNGIKHFASERKSATRQTFGTFYVHGWRPRGAKWSDVQPQVVVDADVQDARE